MVYREFVNEEGKIKMARFKFRAKNDRPTSFGFHVLMIVAV